MARIRLVPTEELTPGLREIAKGAEAHKLNPAQSGINHSVLHVCK